MQDAIALTVPEAVRVSGLSRSRIYEALNSGLPARKAGRRTIILASDLTEFLEKLPHYQPKG